MNKLVVFTCVCAATLAAFSEIKPPKPAPTIAERKAARAALLEKRLKEEGGDVIRPGTMKGWILIADAQSKVDPYILQEVRDLLWDTLNFDIRVVKSEKVDVATAPAALAKSGANAAIFVVEDPALPMILSAPEDRWGIMNITPLLKDAKTQKYVEMRTTKELLRAFACVCGGFSSAYSANTVVGPIRKPADLDGFARLDYPMDVLMRFNHYLKRFGVTPAERAPYDQVVFEDWCPPPANEYQKRIKAQWEADQQRVAKEKAEKEKAATPKAEKPAATR